MNFRSHRPYISSDWNSSSACTTSSLPPRIESSRVAGVSFSPSIIWCRIAERESLWCVVLDSDRYADDVFSQRVLAGGFFVCLTETCWFDRFGQGLKQVCASSIFDHNAFLELVFSLTINFDGFLYNRFARFKICPFKSAWYTNSSSYFFFSNTQKIYASLY